MGGPVFTMGCKDSKDKQVDPPHDKKHLPHASAHPESPRSSGIQKREGMNGMVYGEADKGDLPWDVMCVIFVKDLAGKEFLYRVEVKCVAATMMSELQKRSEWMLTHVTAHPEYTFSQNPVKLTAMVPRKADAWKYVPSGAMTVEDCEILFGTRFTDKPNPTSPEWTYRGEQKKGLRFYATTGVPTGEAGFAFWEATEVDGSAPETVITIANNLDVISNRPSPT